MWKKASHKRPHSIWLHLHENVRNRQIYTDKKSLVAENLGSGDGNAGALVMESDY